MTRDPSLVDLFVRPLNRAGIEYMVSGGFAAIVYGYPRLTLDVDLIVRLSPADASRFASLWPPSEFYCPPVDVIATEAARDDHGHFNVIHSATALRAYVYCHGDNALQRWALERRVSHAIGDEKVSVAPMEYVIAYKLMYEREGGSDRHLRDIARMLRLRGADLDRPALERWIARLGLESGWARAQAMVGRD